MGNLDAALYDMVGNQTYHTIKKGIKGARFGTERLARMRKWLLIPASLVLLVAMGCDAESLGALSVDSTTSINTAITGNPEVKVVDDDGDIITIDTTTRALATITYAHHETHDGNAYLINVNDDDIDVGDTLDLTIITSNTTTWLHSVWEAQGILGIHIFAYENAVTNVAGANLTPVNMNRNSGNMPSGTFRDGDTFTDTGDLLWQWHTGSKRESGGAGQRNEMILKQGTQYLLRIESEIINNAASGVFFFYEHTNK